MIRTVRSTFAAGSHDLRTATRLPVANSMRTDYDRRFAIAKLL
jgi:hypothetical protein